MRRANHQSEFNQMTTGNKILSDSFAAVCGGLLFIVILSSDAEAIPPPEIIRLGPVIAQVFALLMIFFSTVFFFIRSRITTLFSLVQGRRLKMLVIVIPIVVIVTAVAISAVYVRKKNRAIMASVRPAGESSMQAGGVITVAGMEFNITDPAAAVSPKKIAKLLGNKQYIFIDIREPIEFESRHVPGFRNIRLGNLIAGSEYLKIDRNSQIVLLCDSGERSSDASAFLKLKGYQSLFVDKGIRGWIDEKQKFVGSKEMILPEFRNRDKDVSVEESRALIAEGKAVLADLRTAVDYNKGHIEGAVNIPFVNMTTTEVEKALNTLPKGKMVIGISHDRSGKYYSMILGYMLDQRKMQYGGALALQNRNQAL